MNIWMIVYRGAFGQWWPSLDFPLRAATREDARKYIKKTAPGLLQDGSYRLIKFVGKIPK